MAEFIQIKVVGEETVERQIKRISNILPLPSKALNQMAEIWKTAIKRRTMQGKDAYEKDFVPYSKRYAAFRRRTGRPTGKVTLFYQGRMMNAMTHKASNDTIRIYFRSAKEQVKADAHTNGEGNVPQREFLALNSKDLDTAVNFILRNYGN